MTQLIDQLASSTKHLLLRCLPYPLLHRLKKRHYQSVLKNFCEAEEPDLSIVKRLVKTGMTVFDVGANIGVYTRFLSQYVGPEGMVFSFEPVPPTFSYLQAGVNALSLSNVQLNQVALSDSQGIRKMVVPHYADGGSNFYQARLSRAADDGKNLSFDVRTDTLDSMWRNISRKVSFMKIDVEGAEYSCLSGATELLKTDLPMLLIEVAGSFEIPGSSAARLKELLATFGYMPYINQNGNLAQWTSGLTEVNYFFLTDQHVRQL
jgi:FkbM family methyltransferase